MQTTEKQREDSGKAQIALLVVLALAAGGAGVWSELKAAPGTGNGVTQIDVAYGTDTNSISGSVSPNGDGTANVSVFQSQFITFSGPGFIARQNLNFLSAGDPASTTFS